MGQRENERVERERFKYRQRLQALGAKQKPSHGNAPHSYPPDPSNTHQSHSCRHTHMQAHTSCPLSPQQPTSQFPSSQEATFLPVSLGLQQPPAVCIWPNTFSTTLSAYYFAQIITDWNRSSLFQVNKQTFFRLTKSRSQIPNCILNRFIRFLKNWFSASRFGSILTNWSTTQ